MAWSAVTTNSGGSGTAASFSGTLTLVAGDMIICYLLSYMDLLIYRLEDKGIREPTSDTLNIQGISQADLYSKYKLSRRDVYYIFIDVSLVEPRKDVLLVSFNYLDAIIVQFRNDVTAYLFVTDRFKNSDQDKEKLTSKLSESYNSSSFKPHRELRFLEAVLYVGIENLQTRLADLERAYLTAGRQSYLYAHRKGIINLMNDTSRALQALNYLDENDRDVLSLSFANYQKMSKFYNRTDLSYGIRFESSESSSDADYDFLPVKFDDLSYLVYNFVFYLETIQHSVEKLNNYIHADIDLFNIKLTQRQNYILYFSTFSEIVSTAIAIPNLIYIVFGSNYVNFWCSDPIGIWANDGDASPFWGLFGTGISGAVLYIAIMGFYFRRGIKRFK